MKKKWATREFRKSVASGVASRSAMEQRIRGGKQQSELVRLAKVERKVMRQKQERLRQRALELLAIACAAAEELETIEAGEKSRRQDQHQERHFEGQRDNGAPVSSNGNGNGNGNGGGRGGAGVAGGEDTASLEIQRALRSLNDAEALVSRLSKRS